MQNTMRRLGTVLSGGALALGALAVAPSAHAAEHDPAPLGQGIDWAVGQLKDGALVNQYGPDYSTSLDLAFALESAGGHASTVAAIGDSSAAHVSDIITGEAFGDAGSTYAGATAKLAAFVQSLGEDPQGFGGVQLVDRLEAQVRPNGRIFDTSTFGDYANAIGQAYAVRALTAADSPEAAAATGFLLQQQCAGGWFRLDFTKDAAAADQSCDADPKSKPDPDATSFVLLELSDLADGNAKVARAIGRAESWLASQQKADGSFGGGTSTEGSNANSTGLAGWALGELGHTALAERAATWLRTVQAHELVACPTMLSEESGAIAYDTAALAQGRAAGVTDAYQWQLATSQSLPVLQWLPVATGSPRLSAPAGFQSGGASAAYRVSGAAPAQALCLTVNGTRTAVTAATDGTATVQSTLPRATTDVTVSLASANGVVATSTVTVLGAAKPALRLSAAKVKRGKRITVRVGGLAAGEKVALRLGRKTVKSGTATSTGAFTAKLKVAKRQKPGKLKVTVVGQFANRTTSKTIKVVR